MNLLRNNGDGTFGARVDYEVGSWAWGVAFGDIDGVTVRVRFELQV